MVLNKKNYQDGSEKVLLLELAGGFGALLMNLFHHRCENGIFKLPGGGVTFFNLGVHSF